MSFKLDKNNKDSKSKPIGQVANSFFDKIVGEIGNTPAYKQIAIGASSGWISGFLAIRVGKTAALALGGGIILLEIANQKGYIKIRWDKVNRKADKVVNEIKKVTNQDPTWADKIVQFARTNTPFSSGFIGGFLIGSSLKSALKMPPVMIGETSASSRAIVTRNPSGSQDFSRLAIRGSLLFIIISYLYSFT